MAVMRHATLGAVAKRMVNARYRNFGKSFDTIRVAWGPVDQGRPVELYTYGCK